MRTFNYTMNHKADEAYMARMCREGWAATRLVEGVWTFEPCAPGQYVYRVCYLRGKSTSEVEELKRSLAARGIEFVSRYSFWAIFRSEHDFQLYTSEEERAVCEEILRPMRIGAPVSWLAFLAALVLIIGLWNAARDFKTAYLQALLFLEVMNWYDGLVIDKLWVGHSKFWVIPALADIPYVQTWPQMLKKRLGLSLIWAVCAALPAGIAVLLF